MSTVFASLLLAVIVATIVGLTRPSRVLLESRKKVAVTGGVASLVLFILVGVSLPDKAVPVPPVEPIGAIETGPAETNAQSTPEAPKTASKPVEAVKPATSTTKSYQPIFTFSGTGTKKSEPFTIRGDRFKIKYTCTGDFCQAFLFKASNARLVGLIMNSTGSVTDETIEYGSGEYYIDANIMGSYTMTVEDYR